MSATPHFEPVPSDPEEIDRAEAAEDRLRAVAAATRIRAVRTATWYRFGWGVVIIVIGTLISNASFWQGAGVVIGSLITALGFAVAAIAVISWGVRFGFESVDRDGALDAD